MNSRNQIRGHLSFGHGANGGGMPITLNLTPDQLPDQNLRPQGDLYKGPNKENSLTVNGAVQIQILAGRDGAKYAWKRVHPEPGGASDDMFGGDLETALFALEANGVEDVPENSIVTAFYSDVGPWLVFVYGGVTAADPRWQWVLIGDGEGTISDASGGSSSHKAKLSTPDDDGTWTETTDVRVKLRGGECLLNDKYYIGSKNGTITEGETTYDLYHVLGNAKVIVETCDEEGEPICNLWIPPANFAVIENVDCETGEPLA